jgi:hypothetical protein
MQTQFNVNYGWLLWNLHLVLHHTISLVTLLQAVYTISTEPASSPDHHRYPTTLHHKTKHATQASKPFRRHSDYQGNLSQPLNHPLTRTRQTLQVQSTIYIGGESNPTGVILVITTISPKL